MMKMVIKLCASRCTIIALKLGFRVGCGSKLSAVSQSGVLLLLAPICTFSEGHCTAAFKAVTAALRCVILERLLLLCSRSGLDITAIVLVNFGKDWS